MGELTKEKNYWDYPDTWPFGDEVEESDLPSHKSEEEDLTFTQEDRKQDLAFINELFEKSVISGETWNKTYNIPARIVKISKLEIFCECVIDREKLIFETRAFQKHLFEHIPNLEKFHPVLIRIKERSGSSRIDVYDGKNNLVDLKTFDIEDELEELSQMNIDREFTL